MSRFQFSFKNFYKIENLYVNQIIGIFICRGKERKFGQIWKKMKFCRVGKKKKLASKHFTKRAKMFTICLLFWRHAEWTCIMPMLLPPVPTPWAFPGVPKILIFFQNGGYQSERGKSINRTGKHVGEKVKFIYLFKTWKHYIFLFWEKNKSCKKKHWNLGTNDLFHDFVKLNRLFILKFIAWIFMM